VPTPKPTPSPHKNEKPPPTEATTPPITIFFSEIEFFS
jgi:hypothetical protein